MKAHVQEHIAWRTLNTCDKQRNILLYHNFFFGPKIVKVKRNSPHPGTESDMSRPLHIVWAHRWYVLPLWFLCLFCATSHFEGVHADQLGWCFFNLFYGSVLWAKFWPSFLLNFVVAGKRSDGLPLIYKSTQCWPNLTCNLISLGRFIINNQ